MFFRIAFYFSHVWASLVAQLIKNPLVMQETLGQSLGWEDPLEKGKATTPLFGPGEFHGLYSPWGGKESDMTERLSLSFWDSGLSCTRGSSKSAESLNCLLPSARKQESLRQTKP